MISRKLTLLRSLTEQTEQVEKLAEQVEALQKQVDQQDETLKNLLLQLSER